MRSRDTLLVAASRIASVAAIVLLIGMLPWLSGSDPAYTILRARYADLEVTEENLAAVRAELGLDRGPLAIFTDWFTGVLRGDLGVSWISGRPVADGIVSALGVSLTLMAFAFVVALVLAAIVCIPVVRSGLRGRPVRGSGLVAAALTALPEFLLAAVLLVLGAVLLGWFPPFGWSGLRYVVLPALSLGLPAGGLIGRLASEAITQAFSERWVTTWRMAGARDAHLALAAIRRALPSVSGQIGLALIGLTGGAVAVEQVYAIPGLGRATLGAASAQDIPALQAGVLALVLIAVLVGVMMGLVRRLLLGPALDHGTVPVRAEMRPRRSRDLIVPVATGALLVLVIGAGLLRDPYATTAGRLSPPTLALPMGADASGRDLLARIGHGAATTLGVAVVVVAACLLIGLVLGMAPRVSTGPLEIANAAPPIIAGLIVAALFGPSVGGAALAVTAVSWAPLAAHTGALVLEAKARPHIAILPVLGVGRSRVMLMHVMPTVFGPVARHAVLRLPGIALALAALGFLGLGPQQPTPEWGLVLAEGIGYVERAPWAVIAPASALVLTSVLAVAISSLPPRARSRRGNRTTLVPAASAGELEAPEVAVGAAG